ncbi:MAG TPA: DUF2905 domain-containing protein [Planctomycetaceae bacterium]|nr:DUF2905 domain-containing protein [Planctomycetaceae bacterium]
MTGFAKALIALGLLLVGLGVLLLFGGRLGLGRLPGDIVIRGERFTFYFPVATCVLISVLLSLLLWLLRWWRGL